MAISAAAGGNATGANGASKSGRSGRSDPRNDPRRYHTAGAIEDMKKQDSPAPPGGAGIQKRLSWNYGQHIPNNDLQLKTSTTTSSAKCLSSDSMQSSSGVSSTGSLHLSIGSAAGSDQQQQQGQQQKQQWTVERNPIHLRESFVWGKPLIISQTRSILNSQYDISANPPKVS